MANKHYTIPKNEKVVGKWFVGAGLHLIRHGTGYITSPIHNSLLPSDRVP